MANKVYLKQQGFSLIEFAVVVIVLGIIILVVSVVYPGKKPQLRGQTRQLASDIRYIQYYAMTHYIRAKITFDTAANQYSFTDLTNLQPIEHPATKNNFVDVGTKGFSLSASSVDTNFNNNKYIVFDSLGRPYATEAGALLQNDATITLSTGSESMSVTVVPETGRVSTS